MYEKFEQFRIWPERKVDYLNIHENLSFRYFMQEVGLENYTKQEHLSVYNDIVRVFYAHLELPMGDQAICSIVRGQVVPLKM